MSGFLPQRCWHAALGDWRANLCARRHLFACHARDPRLARDIGLSQADLVREANAPFWAAPRRTYRDSDKGNFTMNTSSHAFLDALGSAGPSADRGENMNLYGWLIGSWHLDVTGYLPDGSMRKRPGEWHFGWVLEGRAIQDVWIVPPRGAARAGDAAKNLNAYGTTLRTYDPSIDAWHIQWTEPVTQTYLSMIGRKQGGDIVQLGRGAGDASIRWSFSDIAANAFHWRGEISADGGKIWRTNIEFSARRAPS